MLLSGPMGKYLCSQHTSLVADDSDEVMEASGTKKPTTKKPPWKTFLLPRSQLRKLHLLPDAHTEKYNLNKQVITSTRFI